MDDITPDMARQELARRELQRRQAARGEQSEDGSSVPADLAGMAISGIEHPGEAALNRLKGLGQGVQNVATGYANLIPGVNIPKGHWAGDSPDAKMMEHLTDIGSFFLPGGALGAAGKIPHIANALKKAAPFLEHVPGLNALLKIGKGAGEGAVSSAALSNKEGQGEAAKTGAEFGGGASFLSQLLGAKNPIVNAIARMVTGGAIGAGGDYLTGRGHPYTSAGTGAAAGLLLPKGANMLLNRTQPGMETLEHINPMEVSPAVQAANRLGTPITPAEASGNPFVGGLEGRMASTGAAAAENTKIGMERVVKQNAAIKDLLDTIYDKSSPEAAAAGKQKIQDLYKEAYQWHVHPAEIPELRKDPVVDAAFKRVESDPAYQRKLQDVPSNNYAYLNQVKRALGDMEGSALKAGEKDRAAEFKEARQALVKRMDERVPEYAQAREEAQKSIIRSKIQKAMSKKELKGSTFFNTILKNEDEFNKLHQDLKNVPEAQDKLKDMRLAWKNLINIGKPNSAAFRSQEGLDQSRDWMKAIMDNWNKLTGAKRNVAAIKFINSPDWEKGFAKIAEIKDKEKRIAAMGRMLVHLTTKTGAATAVANSQGSEE